MRSIAAHTANRVLPAVIGPPAANWLARRYWRKRVQAYGVRSVLNLTHSDSEYEQVTSMQERELFPVLRSFLNGSEQVGLDFGAGSGRFSVQLAELINGRILAVDPMERLLESAPKHPNVEYLVLDKNKIPLERTSVDLVWVCLVLGGIHERALPGWIREITRVLRPGGLAFITESTSDKPSGVYWNFRSIDAYVRLFAEVAGMSLVHVHDYIDANERISTMAGRKVLTQP
jgi:SAM-dependent methyltransferase